MEPRTPFTLRFADGAALEFGPRTVVMGIVNVTPDSFSDGGRFDDPGRAVEAAEAMAADGAEILDIGGESTRPGAAAVDVAEEIRRVVPVIRDLARRPGRGRISVDTTKAAVARAALEAGADMVNDVSGFGDPEMLPLLAASQAPVVLMHRRGTPRSMQRDTDYDDLLGTVVGYLRDRVESAVAGGIDGDRIVVDPGIGFGKSTDGNLAILARLGALRGVGRPLLVGASRKNFLGEVLGLPVTDRLEGSLAVAAFAATQGAHVIRAHDVAATVRAVRTIDAIRRGGSA